MQDKLEERHHVQHEHPQLSRSAHNGLASNVSSMEPKKDITSL